VLLGGCVSVATYAVVAAVGVVRAAVYLLGAYERVFTGPITHEENSTLSDLGFREIAILVPMAVLIVFLGVYPKPALDRIEPSVELILDRIESTTDYVVPEFGRTADVVAVETGEEG
jgi:NADH-quinone oxidoreductase subunit M